MIVLCGPSASGKTEVAKLLNSKYGMTKVITTTTRIPRKNEINGRDYFFVSKEEFEKLIRDNKFVEYTVYDNNYYGSRRDQICKEKCIVVDPNGLIKYSEIERKGIVTFYLKASDALRYERMLIRGDHKEDALKRIQNDKIAFTKDIISKADYIIENEDDSLDEVVDTIYKKYKRFLKGIK